MNFKMRAKHDGDNDAAGFWEEFDKPGVTDQASAEAAAQGLIDFFNDTLREGERRRVLLKVVYLGRNGEGNARKLSSAQREEHDWHKQSLITERGGYDRMECSKCGITGRRYGFGNVGIRRESAFKAKGFAYCDTARVLLARREGRVKAGAGGRAKR